MFIYNVIAQDLIYNKVSRRHGGPSAMRTVEEIHVDSSEAMDLFELGGYFFHCPFEYFQSRVYHLVGYDEWWCEAHCRFA